MVLVLVLVLRCGSCAARGWGGGVGGRLRDDKVRVAARERRQRDLDVSAALPLEHVVRRLPRHRAAAHRDTFLETCWSDDRVVSRARREGVGARLPAVDADIDVARRAVLQRELAAAGAVTEVETAERWHLLLAAVVAGDRV